MSLRHLSERLAQLGHPILPSGINKIENGQRRVDVGDLVALAQALDVSPSTLLMPPEPDGDRDNWRAAWRWLHGELPLGWEEGRRSPDWPDRIRAFRRENRPYEPTNPVHAAIDFLRGLLPGEAYELTVSSDGNVVTGQLKGENGNGQRVEAH